MDKNKKLRIILLIIGMLIGPLGTIMAIFKIGDKGFSGRSNVQSLDGYYYLDYLTICASYNLAIIIGLACLAWIIKSGKIRLSKTLNIVLIGQLFFIPSFLVSLFLSVIPMEGNIKGFFIFPAFILTTIGCIIGFLIYFIIRLIKVKKENIPVSDKSSLIPYGVTIVLLVFLNYSIDKHSTTEVDLVSFDHENFTWGIKQRSKTKAGMVKRSTNDPYIAYIKHKNGGTESSHINILKNYHSLYTKLDSIIPLQSKAIEYNNLNPSYSINYNSAFEVVHLNENKSIYRLRKHRPSYTLCLTPSQATLEEMNIIAEDIKQNSTPHHDIDQLIDGFIVEAIAMNNAPIGEEKFVKNDGSSIQVSINGEVGYRDKSFGEDYYPEGLGEIIEGIFYSLSGNFDIEGSRRIPYTPKNYDEFKNEKNQALNIVYKHIDGRKCATDIAFAINNCPDIESVYLLDQNKYNGIPKNINKLKKLSYLNSKGINLGKVPESITDLYFLNTINIHDSKSIEFPYSLSKLNNLYFLNVVNCNLKEIPKPFLNLPQLRDLNLKGNNILMLPKELAALDFLTDIWVDFNVNLDIAPEIILKRDMFLRLYVYSEIDKHNASKFIEQYAKDNEQLREKIYDSFVIDEAY